MIDFGYLNDPTDLPRLRDGVRKGLRLLYSKEMQEVLEGPVPNRQNTDLSKLTADSPDAEIDAFVRQAVFSSAHISATCKMGASSDPLAVCDQAGRVYGVDGLRVVDGSLMPDAVRANLQFTIYMMAERISAQMRHGGSLEAAVSSARGG